jgi:imidazole glycerol-phosphate synthase subunit HisF
MLRPRITPCLLVQNGGLVKTVQFKNARYVGDPINAVKIFNEKETDELIVLDIDATAKNRDPNFRLISQFAVECRMPLCYGGGIKTPAQAKRIIGLGVEKVAISSAAMDDPAIVTAIAQEIGSQSVVVVLDVKKSRFRSGYQVYTRNGTAKTGMSPFDAAKRAEDLGAGEIVVNSIDNDGMMQGYDLELATELRKASNLPMTVLGGASSLADISRLVKACGVIGAAAGSLFVFKGPLRGVLISYPNPAQKEELIRAARL